MIYFMQLMIAEILGISLVSSYENSNDVDDVVVYLLDNGIKEENLKNYVLFLKNMGERLSVNSIERI